MYSQGLRPSVGVLPSAHQYGSNTLVSAAFDTTWPRLATLTVEIEPSVTADIYMSWSGVTRTNWMAERCQPAFGTLIGLQRRLNIDQHVEGFGVFASGASADIEAGALPIDSDARLLAANMHAGQCLDCTLSEGAMAYLVPTAGGIQVNDVRLAARDGAAVTNESALSITAYGDTWVVLLETVLSAKAAVRVAAL
jgi:hypothetical protein